MRDEIKVLAIVFALLVFAYIIYSLCVAAGRADDASERYLAKQLKSKQKTEQKPEQPVHKDGCSTCKHERLGDQICSTCENRSHYEP